MKLPLIFLGPNGPWDLHIFESVEEATSYAEPPDVRSGGYGDHGWDADGAPVVLEVRMSTRRPGLLARLLDAERPEVFVRELEGPREPEPLREALIGRLETLEPDLVLAVDRMGLADLISVVRGVTRARLEEVRSGRYRRAKP